MIPYDPTDKERAELATEIELARKECDEAMQLEYEEHLANLRINNNSSPNLS
jgi:hypothetical protein